MMNLAGAGLVLAFSALPAALAAQSSVGAGRDSSESVTPAAVEAVVDPLVREQLERRRIAGAVVIVVKDGHVMLSRGYGHADIAAGRVMTAETLMRIGSITKMLTALAAMQLVESGRIDLDRDVRDYVDIDIPRSVANGRVEVRRGSHRAYSYRELVALIEAAGFSVELDQPWTRERRNLLFIATRR